MKALLRTAQFLVILLVPGIGATQNPIAIPPLYSADTLMLTVDDHVHEFYPGVSTNTYGVNMPYLGPTLLLQKNDTARLRVNNELPGITNLHWHGLHVNGAMDGGPQREIPPGDHWDVEFPVVNPAGTYWYHPHTHMLTATQATRGAAGLIIVRDDEEAALALPRNYGVDDVPLVIQDRRFLASGEFSIGAYGDSVLINGTPDPFVELPAQIVRLRLLNGSNSRVYAVGFEDDRQFHVIAGDAGLLNAPVEKQRQWLSNGERSEILLDLTGMEGDSLLMMSYGSELPVSVPGANNLLWESSILNGIDFALLRIRVIAPTAEPITSIPTMLSNTQPLEEAEAIRTRNKILSGMGMVGMGMFTIDGLMFDIDVINDTMQLGSVEVWTIQNASNMAHPMHIHGVSFYILERDGFPPPPEEQGAKDVVLVDAGEVVKLIMRFDHVTEGWPFMYHCHNLMHEDNMMMLQFIVEDVSTHFPDPLRSGEVIVFPSPASSIIQWKSNFKIDDLRLMDLSGRLLMADRINDRSEGSLDISHLPAGIYILQLRGVKNETRIRLVKD